MRTAKLVSLLGFSVALSVSLAPAALTRTIYECKFEDRGTNRGWLPTIVVVAYDPGVEEVQVSDPFIEEIHGGPITVVPKKDNDVRLSLQWKLMLTATTQDEYEWTYDFTVYKADQRAKITGTPRGYSGNRYTQGTCKVTKG